MTRGRRRFRRRTNRAEKGFTLVELVITVVLLTLITGALTAAFVTAIGASQSTSQRIRESNDAQVAAAFFVRDAQAAGGTDPLTGAADQTLGVSTTDDGGCPGPGALVVRLKGASEMSGV